ncbi:MAG: D-glycero-beta-D-manno-heptose 1-phosphate adenylyltransferase [Pyrinomonadaceae bacterium]
MVVFTNGCFDIIHAGHIDLLERAKSLGARLVVGINSDESVQAIKGSGRPVQSQEARKAVLLGLKAVDDVIIFDELTPENLINKVRPDVLVKGGDWKIGEIIGADFVQSYGGKVFSLPLKNGFSSSSIVDKIKENGPPEQAIGSSIIEQSLNQHLGVFRSILIGNIRSIDECAEMIFSTFMLGKKVLLCGNGGSAADAQHIAAEFVGRYETERRALPAISLTTDTSALTALANDYDFERIFARQVDALAVEGDCLIAISTSGNSPNVISAVMTARNRGCKVVGMTGLKGKKLASLCDACILVPSERTARIQEAHITIAHIWCEIIDGRLRDQ